MDKRYTELRCAVPSHRSVITFRLELWNEIWDCHTGKSVDVGPHGCNTVWTSGINRRFGETYPLRLHSTKWRQHASPKRRFLSKIPRGVTPYKTNIDIVMNRFNINYINVNFLRSIQRQNSTLHIRHFISTYSYKRLDMILLRSK